MKKIIIIALALIAFNYINACTTAVISGKHTKNGRPMIWKLRDTESFKNKMKYFNDGKYTYIGLINSDDIDGKQVWGGANSMGFSIMNSASFNVNIGDTSKIKDMEGVIMKRALQECETLEDFEKLLRELPKPMGLAAHFGVIDANGGAAFYEVNNYTFTKFDANDPLNAPNGYILRTNYSFTGEKDKGYGFIRYQTAQDIFYQAEAMGRLNYRTIVQDFSRCLKHSVLNKDYRKEFNNIASGNYFVNSGDFITRHGSSSAILIEGVKSGEPKDLATIWGIVGFPNTCIAIPSWVRGGEKLPKILTGDKDRNSPLNEMALDLKSQCYPIKRSSGYKYLQISKLINAEKTGFIQKIEIAEDKVFDKTEENLKKWRENNAGQNKIQKFYKWLDEFVYKRYRQDFGLDIKCDE